MGCVNFETFQKVLTGLGLNQSILGKADIDDLYKEQSDGTKIDYRQFLDNVHNFEFDNILLYEDMKKRQIDNAHDPLDNDRYRDSVKMIRAKEAEDKFEFVDNFVLDSNKLEKVFKNVIVSRRFLKNYFPKQEDFEGFAKQALNIKSYDPKTTLIAREQMKDFVDAVFTKFNNKLSRFKLQELFAFFNSNKGGKVNLGEISDALYNEDNLQFSKRMCTRPNGPPPVYNTNDLPKCDIDLEELKLKRLMTDPSQRANKMTKEQILKKIDDELFRRKERHFDKFSKFDQDKDGFVSANDLRKTMRKLNYFGEPEIEEFVNYIDEDKKGYVTFPEFHKKLKSNMANQDTDV